MRYARTVLVLWLVALGAATAAQALGPFFDPVGLQESVTSMGPYPDPVGLQEPVTFLGPYADPVGLQGIGRALTDP